MAGGRPVGRWLAAHPWCAPELQIVDDPVGLCLDLHTGLLASGCVGKEDEDVSVCALPPPASFRKPFNKLPARAVLPVLPGPVTPAPPPSTDYTHLAADHEQGKHHAEPPGQPRPHRGRQSGAVGSKGESDDGAAQYCWGACRATPTVHCIPCTLAGSVEVLSQAIPAVRIRPVDGIPMLCTGARAVWRPPTIAWPAHMAMPAAYPWACLRVPPCAGGESLEELRRIVSPEAYGIY
jgi:hypothetical protein